MMGIFSLARRFRSMATENERISKKLCKENENIQSVAELRVRTTTNRDIKVLTRKLEKLGITAPGARNIVEWIDWLPYLQSLAEEKNLDEARKTDPYVRTWSRFTNVDARDQHGRKS